MSLLPNPLGHGLWARLLSIILSAYALEHSRDQIIDKEKERSSLKSLAITNASYLAVENEVLVKGSSAQEIQKTVVINEVVTDPQQDWSSNDFNGVPGSGKISSVDEYVELYIQAEGIDLSEWTIELIDGTDFSGDLTSSGAFDVSIYTSENGGTLRNSAVGDFLLLANPDGSNAMNNNVHVILKDTDGVVIDEVKLGGQAAEAPSGNANSPGNEAVFRSPNGMDADNDEEDFIQGPASMSSTNPDLKSPVFENGSPLASEIGSTSLTLTVDLNEAATIYYIVLEEGQTAPSSAQVKAGLANDNSAPIIAGSRVVSSGEFLDHFSVTGLNETTAYDIYLTAEDGNGNLQENAAKINLRTASLPSLEFKSASSFANESLLSTSIEVVLTTPQAKDVTVQFVITGTASSGGVDHNSADGTLTIPSGKTTGAIVITGVVDDALDEDDETIVITLTNPMNAILGSNSVHTYTINDNDALPSLSFISSSSNGAESDKRTSLQVELSAVSERDISVDYVLSGTASGGGIDHGSADGTLTIPSGKTTGAIEITGIVDDALDEDDETIAITLTNPMNAILGSNAVHTYTINDNDDSPTISFASSAANGLESLSSTNIPLGINAASEKDISVEYTLMGTADDTDYQRANGSVTFLAGETNKNITVEGIMDDALVEANETIRVELSNPVNGKLGKTAVFTYTILDNDAARITIADINGMEDEGEMTVVVMLDKAVDGGFSINLSTADETASSIYDSDYAPLVDQILTFEGLAGETQHLSLKPIADAKLEGNETLTLSIGEVVPRTVPKGSIDSSDLGVITIKNDDQASVHINDISVDEHDKELLLTATLNNAVQGGFSLYTSTKDLSALAGKDYVSVADETLNFAGNAGEVQHIQLELLDDDLEESVETMELFMSNLAGTELGVDITDRATISIIDNDDNTAPSGYAISMSDTLIGRSELMTSSFSFIGAEVGSSYHYILSSTGGETNVKGTGIIATSSDRIPLGDLTPLKDGLLTLSVTLTDTSKNIGVAISGEIQKDTQAPEAPIFSSLTNDSGWHQSDNMTNDSTLLFIGKAEENSFVQIFLSDEPIGMTQADTSGRFSFDYSGTSLSDGLYVLTAQAQDAAGNIGEISAEFIIEVDTKAPNMPVVSAISTDSGLDTKDGVTKVQNLIITGTAEANSTVDVFIEGVMIGGSKANESGIWSLDYTKTNLKEGNYQITAIATDLAGNRGLKSGALDISIDTSAPAPPSVDLVVTSDLGLSNTDNLTSETTPTLEGTAEPNSMLELAINGRFLATTSTDSSGHWMYRVLSGLDSGVYQIVAKAIDQAGNESLDSSVLEISIDASISEPILFPLNRSTEVLPDAKLTMLFSEEMNKGKGSITIRQVTDDVVVETLDVLSSNVSISGEVVSIVPSDSILQMGTAIYVNVDAGAFIDGAGNDYAGITNKTDWTFTVISAPKVDMVTIPKHKAYGIGSELSVILTFTRPVTIKGMPSIALRVGDTIKKAMLRSEVHQSNYAVFGFTVEEGDLDLDGISLESTISLNGGSIKDQHGLEASLQITNMPSLADVRLDGVRPVPTLTSRVGSITNGPFNVTIRFDEPVSEFTSSDILVINGIVDKFKEEKAATEWTATITPLKNGSSLVLLPAGSAIDRSGNSSATAKARINTTFDGIPPEVMVIARAEEDQLNNSDTDVNFRIVFSEDVTGVDLTDFEVVTSESARGELHSITAVDATHYTVNVNRISGQGTIGLNVKDDGTIIDEATNSILTAKVGEFYTINWIPSAIELSNSSIEENNAIGEVIGHLSTTDKNTQDIHTYALVAGAGDMDNSRFRLVDEELLASESFDFESRKNYGIRVKTEDGRGGSKEEAFTITLLNELESSIFVSGDGDFGEVDIGQSSSKLWSITNNGELPVEVRLAPSTNGFSIKPAAINVPMGETREFTAVFSPENEGVYSGLLNFQYAGGVESEFVTGAGVIITNINEQWANEGIRLYPNPMTQMNQELIIELSNLKGHSVDLTLMNASGQVLIEKSIIHAPKIGLDLSNYRNGLYLIRIQNTLGVISRKFMIKR